MKKNTISIAGVVAVGILTPAALTMETGCGAAPNSASASDTAGKAAVTLAFSDRAGKPIDMSKLSQYRVVPNGDTAFGASFRGLHVRALSLPNITGACDGQAFTLSGNSGTVAKVFVSNGVTVSCNATMTIGTPVTSNCTATAPGTCSMLLNVYIPSQDTLAAVTATVNTSTVKSGQCVVKVVEVYNSGVPTFTFTTGSLPAGCTFSGNASTGVASASCDGVWYPCAYS